MTSQKQFEVTTGHATAHEKFAESLDFQHVTASPQSPQTNASAKKTV